MGTYTDRILPRFMDRVMRNEEFGRIRARVADGLSGQVLEIGFGSGLNVRYYPTAVDRVLAVEPAMKGRELAERRIAAGKVPVEYVGLDGQKLDVPDASVDHVLTTWTLCTIPDAGLALAEIARVLRPGGALHFAEHGRSPDSKVARWQDRLTPIQRRIAGGCHLNRAIEDLIGASSLELTSLTNYYVESPKPLGYMYEGVATKTPN
ncbi:methyltransferase family protein [Antricoccus suffuscus]|uniref:Methyltransferase family protein n=1 Tax=Antricoccus suffuscus TaxID=1629062 RepID=A0A2T1A290_9ACTN|nr:class I SAM-dependent methyltransferase [Antricoccus suffuscus]PRZ42703.1 methyltransferase family protein [Antricoccus suffuscus]